jgi:integrase
MRGHVAKKGRRYYVVVDIGRDPATGKRRRQWHGSWTRKDDAERALTKIVRTIDEGNYVEPDRVTIESFLLEEWLPALPSMKLRPSTIELYRTLATAYVIPRIGKVPLQKLTVSRLNRLYAELLASGKRDGSPLSAVTTGKVHRLLHRALRDAVKWDRIARNPAAVAEAPRARRAEMRIWNGDEVGMFLDGAEHDRLAALWRLFATTGLRRSEALGLRWCDLNLDETPARLSVRQTLAYVGTRAMFDEPKSKRSRRLVTLEPVTVAALRTHRARQLEERLAIGGGYRDEDLVFCGVDGAPLNPATVSRNFDTLVGEAGLPRISLHGLRHTFATLALLDGIPSKVVAEVLGHSSTTVTDDIYTHVTPGMQADATARVAALIRRPG